MEASREHGVLDLRPRCVGDCCRCFSLERPLDELDASAKDTQTIRQMLIPLGQVRGMQLYTCRHLSSEGNCQIYAERPQMCRDFPGPRPCPYRNCASHGPQAAWKRVWNWILD